MSDVIVFLAIGCLAGILIWSIFLLESSYPEAPPKGMVTIEGLPDPVGVQSMDLSPSVDGVDPDDFDA